MKNIKPLSQDDLGQGSNKRVVHGFDERGFLTPVTPGSTTRARIPLVTVLYVHLSVVTISLLEKVSGYEPSIPQM